MTFLSAYASTLVAVGIAYVVAAPGATGGAIMSALQFLPMVGIISDAMQQLMIAFILRKTVKPKTKRAAKYNYTLTIQYSLQSCLIAALKGVLFYILRICSL